MASQNIIKIDHASQLLLDQPLVRLPYELVHKNLRAARFAVEKDGTYIRNMLKDTATSSMSGKLSSTDDVLKNMDAMIARAKGIKRKLSTYAEDEQTHYQDLDIRLRHLSKLADMHTLDDVKYEVWSRQRLDRLMVDHMLRQGYVEGAAALTSEKDLQGLVDHGIHKEISKIRQALLGGSVREALEWCSDNKKELRKLESTLEFQLRLQQYIELVRSREPRKLLEAMTFARKHLHPYRETFPHEYKIAGVLLAFSPRMTEPDRIEAEALTELYKPKRWSELAQLFTTAAHTLLGLPCVPLLNIALQPGLSALKTPACHTSGTDSSSGAPHISLCPICSTELNELARGVPYAHHSVSHVDADLVMLPNGRTYGREKVKAFTEKNGLDPSVEIRDPATGEVYPAVRLKRVYIT